MYSIRNAKTCFIHALTFAVLKDSGIKGYINKKKKNSSRGVFVNISDEYKASKQTKKICGLFLFICFLRGFIIIIFKHRCTLSLQMKITLRTILKIKLMLFALH